MNAPVQEHHVVEVGDDLLVARVLGVQHRRRSREGLDVGAVEPLDIACWLDVRRPPQRQSRQPRAEGTRGSNPWQTGCVSEDVSQPRIDRAALEIAATPEELYAAFADPAKLMEWLPPGSMTGRALEYDFREGGRYRIALTYDETSPASVGKTEGRTDVSTGRFLTLEPGRRIVQSVEFESTDVAFAGEMLMTWVFEPTPAGTKVTITAENVPSGISPADHDAGLHSSLENLARFMS